VDACQHCTWHASVEQCPERRPHTPPAADHADVSGLSGHGDESLQTIEIPAVSACDQRDVCVRPDTGAGEGIDCEIALQHVDRSIEALARGELLAIVQHGHREIEECAEMCERHRNVACTHDHELLTRLMYLDVQRAVADRFDDWRERSRQQRSVRHLERPLVHVRWQRTNNRIALHDHATH
jgi:hypothetical protein